jgi:hypothetical protein
MYFLCDLRARPVFGQVLTEMSNSVYNKFDISHESCLKDNQDYSQSQAAREFSEGWSNHAGKPKQ